jgi:hypothetical protein
MKRTPLTRKTPMSRSSSQLRRSAMPRSRPGKQPPERADEAFKRFVRTLPCCAPMVDRYPTMPADVFRCGNRPSDPHHKHGDGKGIKTHDRTCVPLCRFHHDDAEGKRGVFSGFTKQQTRDWHDAESKRVVELYEKTKGTADDALDF